MSKGREQMVVILLLVLFGFMTVLVLSESNNAYQRIMQTKTDLENVKIAASYLNTKLRQSDVKGSIVLGEHMDIYEDKDVFTRIFIEGGQMSEMLLITGAEVTSQDAYKIAQVDDIDYFFDEMFNKLTFVVKKGKERISGEISFKTKAVRR